MRGGPRFFPQGFSCLVVLWILPRLLCIRLRGFHPLRPAFPGPFPFHCRIACAVRTPGCTHPGLGSSGSARRYSRNRCFFLFLRLLRCFSSPGSLCMPMDSACSDGGFLRRVSPFRHPWIAGCLRLPMAFRSLPRLSSALSAKASALCPSLLNPSISAVHSFASSVALLEFLYFCSAFFSDVSYLLFRHDILIFLSVFGFQGTDGIRGLPLMPDGLKWTRTTDLTLIRRAL